MPDVLSTNALAATMQRRSLLKGTAGILATGIFPAVHSAEPLVLRYLGTAVNQDKAIAEKFKADTGITIQYVAVTTDDVTKRAVTSWAELLNPEFKGKAAILNIPSIGIMDAAMVVEAMGIYKYPDKGNMTKKEIDLTIKTLIEAKKQGQFRALWKDFNESVNLMASGEVVIQSMWSPAVTAVRTKGIACTFQPLKEGYRAWAAGFGLPATLKGKTLDGAYAFINWFLDGWAGAYLNRQGYYSAVLDTAKSKMEAYEWAYWMEGKPATQDIKSPTGDVLAKTGAVRDGGSYEARMGGIACWNALMDENNYMVQKWNGFIAA